MWLLHQTETESTDFTQTFVSLKSRNLKSVFVIIIREPKFAVTDKGILIVPVTPQL
jgi:hypothetical protein